MSTASKGTPHDESNSLVLAQELQPGRWYRIVRVSAICPVPSSPASYRSAAPVGRRAARGGAQSRATRAIDRTGASAGQRVRRLAGAAEAGVADRGRWED